jgi:hypothetical protein
MKYPGKDSLKAPRGELEGVAARIDSGREHEGGEGPSPRIAALQPAVGAQRERNNGRSD